ncbi:MAG TPA: hypothetical protein VG942_01195, partial [Hyphomonadaceae bacterium]|nr:hypothetical protein [Hyphomonadaceae bacterium]
AKFADLRNEMENDWTPGLQATLGLETRQLPALWDADFMWRAPGHVERSRYVLCEINVSSVSPFPPSAVQPVAATVLRALAVE